MRAYEWITPLALAAMLGVAILARVTRHNRGVRGRARQDWDSIEDKWPSPGSWGTHHHPGAVSGANETSSSRPPWDAAEEHHPNAGRPGQASMILDAELGRWQPSRMADTGELDAWRAPVEDPPAPELLDSLPAPASEGERLGRLVYGDDRHRASCGHLANEDGECGCAFWPEPAPPFELDDGQGDELDDDAAAVEQDAWGLCACGRHAGACWLGGDGPDQLCTPCRSGDCGPATGLFQVMAPGRFVVVGQVLDTGPAAVDQPTAVSIGPAAVEHVDDGQATGVWPSPGDLQAAMAVARIREHFAAIRRGILP